MEYSKGVWDIITRKYKASPKEIITGIGIQESPGYFKVLFNTVLPDSDNEYIEQHNQIKADCVLATAAPLMYEAIKEFIRKVDAGEAKSTRSYNQMKEAIKNIKP